MMYGASRKQETERVREFNEERRISNYRRYISTHRADGRLIGLKIQHDFIIRFEGELLEILPR
jgi:hypothetical protein